jgi:hypothetical protein
MENDAPVVGPDAPTANSKMVKLDIGDRLESANFRFAGNPAQICCRAFENCRKYQQLLC